MSNVETINAQRDVDSKIYLVENKKNQKKIAVLYFETFFISHFVNLFLFMRSFFLCAHEKIANHKCYCALLMFCRKCEIVKWDW